MKQNSLEPIYKFEGNTFSNIKVNERGGGVISIYGLTTTAVISVYFNSIIAYNIKSATGITGLEGGVLYA